MNRTKPRNSQPPMLVLVLVLAMVLLAACGGGSSPSSSQGSSGSSGSTAGSQPAAKSSDQPAASETKPSAPAKPVEASLSIGTHPQGSSYNATGAGVAKVVTENSSVKITVKPFSGPNAWMPLLNKGELDLGVLSSPDAGWSFTGGFGYPQANKNVRLLVNGNTLTLPGFAVRADAGIKKLTDLKGKKVASGYAGNQLISQILGAQLATAGLSWDDVQQVPVTDINTGLQAVREGRAVASFGGAPITPPAVETDAATNLINLSFGDWDPEQVASFPKDKLKEITSRVPGAVVMKLKAGTGWLDFDSVGMGYPITLAASAQLSEEAAYQVVKTLWENDTKLHPIYAWLKGWNHDTFFSATPAAPYHPGAVRFYKEVGVWTDEAEASQQELLKKAQ